MKGLANPFVRPFAVFDAPCAQPGALYGNKEAPPPMAATSPLSPLKRVRRVCGRHGRPISRRSAHRTSPPAAPD